MFPKYKRNDLAYKGIDNKEYISCQKRGETFSKLKCKDLE